jgi:hypothetical protein
MPTEPFRLGEDYIVYRVKERVDAVRADFSSEDRARITDALFAVKQAEVLAVYVRRLRESAEAAGDVRINEEVLTYPAAEGEEEGGEGSAPAAPREEPASN